MKVIDMKKLICFLISMAIIGGIVFYNHNTTPEEIDTLGALRPKVTFTLENGASFELTLYPDEAPNSVSHFLSLCEDGFYNGLVFNKLTPNFLVQTGDTVGNGTGYPGYFVPSECANNGFTNNISFEAGVVCLSRGAKYNTEGSQFFVLLTARRDLEGQYAAFGKVTEGLALLEQLSELALTQTEQRAQGWQIVSTDVETFGISYGEPLVLSLEEVIAMR